MLWIEPFGASFAWALPALAFSSMTLAGMLKITQCHQPLPVGASGSYMVRAKLLVPSGGSFHIRAGEMSPPLQPKPLKTCLSGTVLPAATSGLESSKAPTWPAKPSASAAEARYANALMDGVPPLHEILCCAHPA